MAKNEIAVIVACDVSTDSASGDAADGRDRKECVRFASDVNRAAHIALHAFKATILNLCKRWPAHPFGAPNNGIVSLVRGFVRAILLHGVAFHAPHANAANRRSIATKAAVAVRLMVS
jgi:hypothetical protein